MPLLKILIMSAQMKVHTDGNRQRKGVRPRRWPNPESRCAAKRRTMQMRSVFKPPRVRLHLGSAFSPRPSYRDLLDKYSISKSANSPNIVTAICHRQHGSLSSSIRRSRNDCNHAEACIEGSIHGEQEKDPVTDDLAGNLPARNTDFRFLPKP